LGNQGIGSLFLPIKVLLPKLAFLKGRKGARNIILQTAFNSLVSWDLGGREVGKNFKQGKEFLVKRFFLFGWKTWELNSPKLWEEVWSRHLVIYWAIWRNWTF